MSVSVCLLGMFCEGKADHTSTQKILSSLPLLTSFHHTHHFGAMLDDPSLHIRSPHWKRIQKLYHRHSSPHFARLWNYGFCVQSAIVSEFHLLPDWIVFCPCGNNQLFREIGKAKKSLSSKTQCVGRGINVIKGANFAGGVRLSQEGA